MDMADDPHLEVCQDIEQGLKEEYQANERLTDAKAIFALDMAKIAVKQAFGFAKSQAAVEDTDTRGVIAHCVGVGRKRIVAGGPNLDEYLKRIDKVRRSVARHMRYGERGYYDFIRQYL